VLWGTGSPDVSDIVGYTGALTYDISKPDGTPRKRLDVSRLKAMGWTHASGLREGIVETTAGWLKAES